MIFVGGLLSTDGGTRVVDGETLAGWCVMSRSSHGRTHIMLGPVVTIWAPPAFSGARTHSNNTTEMTAMIEALSFLGLHGPVDRNEQSCIYHDALHAAGICLGTIQARTHVQLALACQRSMIVAQRKLRLTMQHVYGHIGNLGNGCADHAAALGTLSFPSSHNITARWITITLMLLRVLMAVTAIMRSWDGSIAFERILRLFPIIGFSLVFTIEFTVLVVHLT